MEKYQGFLNRYGPKGVQTMFALWLVRGVAPTARMFSLSIPKHSLAMYACLHTSAYPSASPSSGRLAPLFPKSFQKNCLFSTGNQGSAAQWEFKKGLRVLAIGAGHDCVCALAVSRLGTVTSCRYWCQPAGMLAWEDKHCDIGTDLTLYWMDNDPYTICFVRCYLDILEM